MRLINKFQNNFSIRGLAGTQVHGLVEGYLKAIY
jgi:hypothetical protein